VTALHIRIKSSLHWALKSWGQEFLMALKYDV